MTRQEIEALARKLTDERWAALFTMETELPLTLQGDGKFHAQSRALLAVGRRGALLAKASQLLTVARNRHLARTSGFDWQTDELLREIEKELKR